MVAASSSSFKQKLEDSTFQMYSFSAECKGTATWKKQSNCINNKTVTTKMAFAELRIGIFVDGLMNCNAHYITLHYHTLHSWTFVLLHCWSVGERELSQPLIEQPPPPVVANSFPGIGSGKKKLWSALMPVRSSYADERWNAVGNWRISRSLPM